MDQNSQLEAQLQECLIAQQGLRSDFGQLLEQFFTEEITRLTRDVTSEKYRKDFQGYNNALSDLLAYRRILKKLQIAASPIRETKIKEKLDLKENA